MGQRPDLARQFDRAGASGIAASAALEATEAVDPGKADQRAHQDGADGNRDPARGGRARGGRFGHIVCHPVSDTAMQCSRYGRNHAAFRRFGDKWQDGIRIREREVMSNKMWGGRFTERPDAIMEEINVSIDVDRHMYAQDIAASKAHSAMLAAQGIISANDAKSIARGLDTILSEIAKGDFDFKRALEDIHMNVESRLTEL